MDHQGRHVDLGHVRTEVGFREGGDAVDRALERSQQGDVEGLGENAFGDLLALVGAIEHRGEVSQELGTVLQQTAADTVENALVDALGEVRLLPEQRGDGAEQRQLADPCRTVARQVAGDIATAHGEAHQGDVAQIQVLDQLLDVVGEGVVVIAIPRLAGAPEAAPVEGDGAVAVAGQMMHLVVPHVGVQWPAVAEQHGLAAAPVLEIDLDAIAGGEGAHGCSPLRVEGVEKAPERALSQGAHRRLTLGMIRNTTSGTMHRVISRLLGTVPASTG